MIDIREQILESKPGFFYTVDTVYHEDGVKEAMDEYAKIDAINFLKWREGLKLVKQQNSGEWLINLAMSEYSLFAKNDEELYQKYKKLPNEKDKERTIR